jgi:hypothetical protein
MTAQDGRRVGGLLYHAAVRNSGHEHELGQGSLSYDVLTLTMSTCGRPFVVVRLGDMSFFETVLISALTSAGVTLAIEWAAKPRLEVRKERILEEAKAKRTVEKNLETIVNLATSLDAGTSGQDTLSVILLVSAGLETSLAAVALKIDPRTAKFISQAATWIQDPDLRQ